MRKTIFILLFLITNVAFASRPVIDSLSKKVKYFSIQKPSFGRDTLLINALWELGYYATYFRENNAKLLLDSLQRLANQTQWQAGKGMFLINKSFYESYVLNDFSSGLTDALKAKEILKKTTNYRALAYANLRISSIMLWNLGNQKNDKFSIAGIQAAKEIIILGEKTYDFDVECQGYIYAANHYNINADTLNAYQNLRKAEEIIKNHKVSYLAENVFYGTYGVLLSFTNHFEKAVVYWDKCLKIAAPQNDFYTLTSMNRLKSDYYFMYAKNKDLDLALSLANESYKYAQQFGVLKFISLAEKNLYIINRLKGDNDNALKYFEFHWSHEDSLSRERIQKTYADYNLLQKETQIKTLENEKLQTVANRQKMIRNLLIICLLLGIGLIVYFFKNNQKLKAKNREIEEALFKGQTIERKRVATELHDNLSAKISGVKWRLEAIQPDFKIEKQRQIYESSVNALSEIYTDVRLISHNLLPIELETKGLTVAVENLVKELNSLEKTKFSLKISENVGRFDNRIEYELFSIILELSNNILKHSGATDALISLQKTDNQLKLLVNDNGKGFDTKHNNSGIGIKNLYSRIEALHGFLKIENKTGVQVKIEIPVVG